MKFLDEPDFEAYSNRYLDQVPLEEQGVWLSGRVEKYSCTYRPWGLGKLRNDDTESLPTLHTGKDVRQDRIIRKEVQRQLTLSCESPDLPPASPLGPRAAPSTGRLLAQLIRVLNISF